MANTIKFIKVLIYLIFFQGRYKAYISFRSKVMRFLSGIGLYESNEFKALSKFVSKGDNVIDVGANLGVYTDALSKIVGKNGKVFVFEPLSDLAQALESRYSVDNSVQVYPLALSSAEGTLLITIPKLFNILPEPALAHASNNEEEATIKVKMSTLDAIIPVGTKISFIKVDIEGHEESFLDGAKRVLAESKPVIQLEISNIKDTFDRWNQYSEKIGYQLMRLDSGELMPVISSEGLNIYNFYLLPIKEEV